MKKIILLFFMLLPALSWAQVDAKYLAGAVPVENGYVTFKQTIQAPSLSQQDIYQAILSWASQKYQTSTQFPNNHLITQDESTGEIGVTGEEFITFSSSFLALDRTRIYYQLRINCLEGSCEVEMSHILYWYEEERNGGERYRAEELITDEHGLNKKKTKLARVIGKFRQKTIDFKDQLFQEIVNTIGTMNINTTTTTRANTTTTTGVTIASPTAIGAGAVTTVATAATAAVEALPTNASDTGQEMNGFKEIAADRIPGNIIQMLTDNHMLITAGNEEKFNPMTASWGGLGNLYNRPVTYCFIDPDRYTYELMQHNETYTLTFYTSDYQNALQYCGTHSGRDGDKIAASGLTPITTSSGNKAFAEAWLIIECKKIASQLLTPASITDGSVKAQYPDKQTELFVGEIIGVWTK